MNKGRDALVALLREAHDVLFDIRGGRLQPDRKRVSEVMARLHAAALAAPAESEGRTCPMPENCTKHACATGTGCFAPPAPVVERQHDIYAWLGYWRDKMPLEAVEQLQDILGPLALPTAPGEG